MGYTINIITINKAYRAQVPTLAGCLRIALFWVERGAIVSYEPIKEASK